MLMHSKKVKLLHSNAQEGSVIRKTVTQSFIHFLYLKMMFLSKMAEDSLLELVEVLRSFYALCTFEYSFTV